MYTLIIMFIDANVRVYVHVCLCTNMFVSVYMYFINTYINSQSIYNTYNSARTPS